MHKDGFVSSPSQGSKGSFDAHSMSNLPSTCWKSRFWRWNHLVESALTNTQTTQTQHQPARHLGFHIARSRRYVSNTTLRIQKHSSTVRFLATTCVCGLSNFLKSNVEQLLQRYRFALDTLQGHQEENKLSEAQYMWGTRAFVAIQASASSLYSVCQHQNPFVCCSLEVQSNNLRNDTVRAWRSMGIETRVLNSVKNKR